jgi:hypothetical protein
MHHPVNRGGSIAGIVSACSGLALILSGPLPARAAEPEVTDTAERGSCLIYQKIEVRWNGPWRRSDLVQDTFITLVNGYPENVGIFGHYVAENGNHMDFASALTPNQPAYWSAATGQPGPSGWSMMPFGAVSEPWPDPEGSGDYVLRGFLVLWATDYQGREINWNYLTGGATVVDYETPSAWEYRAAAFRCVSGVNIGDPPDGTPGQLLFDANEYAAAPDVLTFEFFPAGGQLDSGDFQVVVLDGDLSLVPVTMDFRDGGGGLSETNAEFTIHNENEVMFTGPTECVWGWSERRFSNYGSALLRSNLQTDGGTALIDTTADALCPGSLAVPLVGVSAAHLSVGGLLRKSGRSTQGAGSEVASIRSDLVLAPVNVLGCFVARSLERRWLGLTLTAFQPVHWSAATGLPAGVQPVTDMTWTVDPSTSDEYIEGTLMLWAVDELGREISWNQLTGSAVSVDQADGTSASYSAYAFRALDQGGAVGPGDQTGSPWILNLDGMEFDAGFDILSFEFFAVGSQAFSMGGHAVDHDGLLTLAMLQADLRAVDPVVNSTRAQYYIWNENENLFSGQTDCVVQWFADLLSGLGGHFNVYNLQTDLGFARIDTWASDQCDVLEEVPPGSGNWVVVIDAIEAPLLGAGQKRLTIDSAQVRSASALPGAGMESASIRYDDDCENDGVADGWSIASGAVPDVNLNGIPDGCEVELVDIEAGLIPVTSSSAAWGDYDSDGDLDLALAGYVDTSTYVSRIYRNDAGELTDIGAGLMGVARGSVAWGDYDNDGDLDLALAGASIAGLTSRIYRNDAGMFTDIQAGLPGVWYWALDWGDYDNDGDLDLALGGLTGGGWATRVYRNDNGIFTDIVAGLAEVGRCALAWGDYDNDGDLDLALAGAPGSGAISRIYRNDGGVFIDIEANLAGVSYCALAWGDYDNDRDLDLALAGTPGSGFLSRIYRNDSGMFTDIGAELTGVAYCSLAWGDYDNDGDLDLVLAGLASPDRTARVYRNDAGVFSDAAEGLLGVSSGALAWGDYDDDGDLDLALAGTPGSGAISRIYRNEGLLVNSVPDAPTALSATNSGLGEVTLSWNAASDAETPADGLSYNLRVGTSPGDDDVFCGMADLSTGLRRLPDTGNAQKMLGWTVKDLDPGTYYWSVQAIDTAFAGSAWAADELVTIETEPADIDGDGDVDMDDVESLFDALNGPDVPSGSQATDMDGDGDCDIVDVLLFQPAFTGPGH